MLSPEAYLRQHVAVVRPKHRITSKARLKTRQSKEIIIRGDIRAFPPHNPFIEALRSARLNTMEEELSNRYRLVLLYDLIVDV